MTINFNSVLICIFLIYTNTANASIPFLSKIKNQKNFDLLSQSSINNLKGEAREVKIVFEINTDRLYFMNSKQFKFHYEFYKEILKDPDLLYTFKGKNYSKSKDRKYYLASLVYFKSKKLYALKFIPTDKISSNSILTLKLFKVLC